MVFGYGAAESEAGRKLIKLSGNTDFLIAAGLVLLYVKIYSHPSKVFANG